MDLLQNLLEPSPIKRYSANYALKHKFFADIPVENDVKDVMIDFQNYKDEKLSPFSPLLKPSFNSFVMRKAILNGRVDTIEKLSENNFSSINSFKENKRNSCQPSKSKFGIKYSSSLQIKNSEKFIKKQSLQIGNEEDIKDVISGDDQDKE